MILACHNIEKSFGDRVIVHEGSFHIEEREKAADKEIDGPEENVCPRCGAPVEEDQGFCIICGAKLEKAGAGAAYQAEPERPAGPRICPNCGKVLPPQMRFCTSCGTKMN